MLGKVSKSVWLTLWCAVIVVLIIGIGDYQQIQTQSTAATQQVQPVQPIVYFPNLDGEVWLTAKNLEVTVPLETNRWSKKICLPPGTRFVLDVTEELHGVKFWDGKIWDRNQLLGYQSKKDGWFGTVPHCTFRLLGKGEAKITLEIPN